MAAYRAQSYGGRSQTDEPSIPRMRLMYGVCKVVAELIDDLPNSFVVPDGACFSDVSF